MNLISKILVPKQQHFSSLYLNACQLRYYHIAFVTASLPTQKKMSIFLCITAKSFLPPPHGDTSPTNSTSYGPTSFHYQLSRDISIAKQQEMQQPDLSLYTHITTLSFRLIKLSIQVDHCSEAHCLLSISLQLCLPESQVQKSSLTPAIAHTSAPWKRSLLGGKLRRILCSDMGDERSWFLCTHAVAMPQFANQASERSLNISILK